MIPKEMMAEPKDSKLTDAAMAPDVDVEKGEVAKPETANTAADGAEAEEIERMNSNLGGDLGGGATTAAPADPEAMAATTPKADD